MNKQEVNKSDTALREEEILHFWKENLMFEKSLEKEAPKGEFVFYDGPPFATGTPHMGHLLASGYKDAIGRYKTMQGYHVPRRWGWDCHGLPVESIVEKKLGLKTKKDIEAIGIEKFNAEARASVLRFVSDWEWYVDRIGRWVDFKNSYKTMDNSYMESVWWALKTLHEKKLLYEGNRVLMYCTHCETPLAKAEIQMDDTYKDVTEEAVTVKFKVKDPEKHNLPPNTYLLAWTTTPWTLPGNVGLAIGEKIKYVLIKKDNEHFIVAQLRGQAAIELPSEIIRPIRADELIGIQYEPLYTVDAVEKHTGKKHEVLAAEFVTDTDGTGVVHTAVMYGEDDYNLGKTAGLPMVQLLTANGTYNDKAPELVRGMFYKKGGKYVLEDLAQRGLVFHQAPNTHSYPHCYRCGASLIYNAVSSWFLGINQIPDGGNKTIKERLIEENNDINWVPDHLKHGRFEHILEGAPDWTISRNRFWATPLPIWRCGGCPEVVVIGSLGELRSRAQQLVPEDQDLHRPYIDAFTLKCEKCNGEMKRTVEVVDCWVESGSMPFAALNYPHKNKELFEKRFPGDFITEYIAQTRTWFYYTHAMGVMLFDSKAFKNVTSTGTVLAADGEKMSKSKGNYTDPKINLDKYGADALRFYLLGAPVMQAEDTSFRDTELSETHSRIINMLWNSYTFYQLYAKDVIPTVRAEESPNVLDIWIYTRLAYVVNEVTTSLENYETVPACRSIRDFIGDYSTWYLRRSRDRIKEDGDDKQYALATMRHTLLKLSRLIAPLMPFIAESIYRGLHGEGVSVHLAEWPQSTLPAETTLINDMFEVLKIVTAALEARSTVKIKVRQVLALLQITDSNPLTKSSYAKELLQVIAEEVNVKTAEFASGFSTLINLDTVITPELKREGDVRELLRAVQEERKKMGMNPGESATLSIHGDAEFVAFVRAASEQLEKVASISQIEEKENDATKVNIVGEGRILLKL